METPTDGPSWLSKAERKEAALIRAHHLYEWVSKFPPITRRLIDTLLEQFPYSTPSRGTSIEDVWRLAGAHDVIDTLEAVLELQQDPDNDD